MEELTTSNAKVLDDNKALRDRLRESEIKQIETEKKLNTLEYLLDLNEQEKIKPNILISGFETTKDNMKKVVREILTNVDNTIKNTDIADIAPTGQSENNKFNQFIVKLASEDIKNQIMQKKKLKKIFTTQINIPDCMSNKQILFQHHLSKLQKKLYFEARKIKSSKNFKFLWVKDGVILLRESTETRKIYRITNFNHINAINEALGISNTSENTSENSGIISNDSEN
jgi:hypothetical protein